MTDERKALLQRMARAAYHYATERQTATWEGKRSGLTYEQASVNIRSCGAFRSWNILAHDGVVGWCVDGYKQRASQNETGGVYVLIGDGKFVFPVDESRSHHSLAFATSGDAKLISVTHEDAVPWEPRIEAMATELELALARLREAVQLYDDTAKHDRELKRSAEVAAASQQLLRA